MTYVACCVFCRYEFPVELAFEPCPRGCCVPGTDRPATLVADEIGCKEAETFELGVAQDG